MSFSIKVNSQRIQQARLNTQGFVARILKDEGLKKQIADTVINDIKFQSRRGKSPVTGSSFKKLSDSWIKERTGIIKTEGKPPYVSRNRSNISLSGQLLDSLVSVPVNKSASALDIKIRFGGTHIPYKSAYQKTWKVRNAFGRGQTLTFVSKRNGIRTIGRRIRNEELADYVQEDRPFMAIRTQVQKRLRALVQAEVRRQGLKLGLLRK